MDREQNFLITSSLLVLAAVAGSFALYWTASLMIPFVISLLLSYLVGPIVDVVQIRFKAPRGIALLVALLVLTGGIALLVLMLWTSARGLAENADLYQHRIIALGDWALLQVERLPEGWVPPEWTREEIDPREVLANVDVQPILGTIGYTAGGVVGFLSTLLSNSVLVLLFSVYLLIGRTPLQERSGFWGEIDQSVRNYLVTKFFTSAATGLITWLILALLGLDLAMVFGVLAFLLNFIPNIGSLLAMTLPVPIAMIQFDTAWAVFLVVALPGAAQFTIGNLVEPKLMGDSLDLHPVTVLLALIFWGLLWGPAGMLLSAPITAVMRIVLERFDTTRPVGELLAGRIDGIQGLSEGDGTA